MYSAPSGYEDAAKSIDRAETLYMSMGADIDNTAADDLDGFAGSSLPMSNTAQLADAVYQIDSNLATYEGDGIPTAANAAAMVPPTAPAASIRSGWWSDTISDADGLITAVLTMSLTAAHTSALTIYTDGPNILAGTATFHLDGEDDVEVELECHQGYAVAKGSNTYDSITLAIAQLDQPYRHLRIVEFEFGDSITISTQSLAHEVTYIDEVDPLGQGMPMRELDFDLINVNGEYDEDNPDSRFERLAIGNPINLSYTIFGGGRQYTVPMGRFVLAEKRPNGNCLTVVAYDTRWYLSQTYDAWGISASEDLGTTLDRLLTSVEIAHEIDPDVFLIYPVADHTFSTDTAVLDDIQAVCQAYGLVCVPDRYGSIMILTDHPSDDYGLLRPDMQFSWPESSQMNRYNYIDVYYNGGHYVRDLRDNPNTTRTVITVSNSLIVTEAQAISVCNRIAAHIWTRAVTVQWTSDPALDLYDDVDIYSRWTLNGEAATFRPVKREITFNGMLKEESTFIQRHLH